jgi:hypothetical protein
MMLGQNHDANAVLRALLEEEQTPEDAATQLWTIADRDPDGYFPLLADFRNLAITLDVMEEFEADGEFDRAAWRQELRELARRTLARGGVSHELILDGDRVCTLDELDDEEDASDGA